MLKRAIAYGRVSGDDRDNDGRNLKGQLDMCAAYIRQRSYELVDLLAEDVAGASGAEIDLPVLSTIRTRAAANEFDVLVVREIDRLSRSLAKQLIVEEELKRYGVAIEYVLGEYPDTAEGNLMKHVKASVAEYEREKIKERMVRGRLQKVAAGKLLGNCLPFGYRKVGRGPESVVQIDEEKAKHVQWIFKRYVADGWSMRAIASKLTELGVEPPGVAKGLPADFWGFVAVRRILLNKCYVGEFEYGGHVVQAPDLAIVDRKTFKAAGERQGKNGRFAHNTKSGRYLLMGRFMCSCKRRMSGKRTRDEYYYYRCHHHDHHYLERDCWEKQVRVDRIEGMVWDWLSGIMSDPAALREGLEGMAAEREARLAPQRARLEDVERLILKADRTVAGLMATFDPDSDEEVKAILKLQVERQVHLKNNLKSERATLVAEIERGTIPPEQVESVLAFAEKVNRRMGRASWTGKRKLMQVLNVQVSIFYQEEVRKVLMSCDLPSTDQIENLDNPPVGGNLTPNVFNDAVRVTQ